MRFQLIIAFLLTGLFAVAQPIIPQPNQLKETDGSCPIPETITIASNQKQFTGLIQPFQASLLKYSGRKSEIVIKNAFINILINKNITSNEAYRLKVEPRKITIEAGFDAGCFYGLQSLLQLLSYPSEHHIIPCLEIADQPRFEWRGLMLDESRHFFGTEEVKKILELMALQKLNKFHWHLTDSPGWRIQIQQYPLLTTVGGKGNHSHPEAPAAFYTQEQIAEIVRYASERFIEVIPEIDMPGHATAAARAYPEYSGGGSQKYPDFTFNPGKEETYSFLTNVLKEVANLFPSKYIHIGGDEVSYGNQQWNNITEIQQLIKREKLKDLLGVEHYFLRRMADSIQKLGKTMMGWDEVVTAGLTTHPRVMWWRHEQPKTLELALQNGYEVILCPRIPLYFDFVQLESHKSGRKWGGKFAPLESVYNFPSDQFTGGISCTNPLVKGIQANLWTETMHTNERLEFMTFPRMTALAEAAWSKAEVKDFKRFQDRLVNMKKIYQQAGVRFFDPDLPEMANEIAGPQLPKN